MDGWIAHKIITEKEDCHSDGSNEGEKGENGIVDTHAPLSVGTLYCLDGL